VLKKLVDAIKDLVQDCNFECNDTGIGLQAMDSSHVALVSMLLQTDSFSPYRCDRNVALGVNLNSLTKVLKAAQNEDTLQIQAQDTPDSLNLIFESTNDDRISEYDLKLMDIDTEHLGIPDTDYFATIAMPASEFQRICRDFIQLSESVTISATKEGVQFSCAGDIGKGSVTLKQKRDTENENKSTTIELNEPVSLTFSLKYLANFCKGGALAEQVHLRLKNDVPLLVEYIFAGGHLRYYLAPKIGDADDQEE